MPQQFRIDNTEGFTGDELDALNDAFDALKNEFPDVEDSKLYDMLSNAVDETTTEALIARVSARLTR
jgi:hypothetical protein